MFGANFGAALLLEAMHAVDGAAVETGEVASANIGAAASLETMYAVGGAAVETVEVGAICAALMLEAKHAVVDAAVRET